MPATPRRAVVIGDALLDVRIVPSATAAPGGDVPADVAVARGGQGANVAVRLARRGVDVVLVTALAEDAAGTLVRAGLADEGVQLHVVPATMTGTVAVLVGPDGERTMYSQRVAFSERVSQSPPADWTVVSGYLFLEPGSLRLAERTAGARDGRVVVLGCDVPPDARARWRDAVAAARPDLVLLNADEAAWAGDGLAGVTVVTDNSGAWARLFDDEIRVAAASHGAVRDTTGAGDAFAAALVASLERTWPPSAAALRRAMESGIALAAEVAGSSGAQGGVPSEGGTLRP